MIAPSMQVLDVYVSSSAPLQVVYTGQNGYDHDHETASEAGLEAGNVYNVIALDVQSWSTNVYLQETQGKKFPSGRQVYFNSVLFCTLQEWQEFQAQSKCVD